VGHSEVGEWSTGGISHQDLAARSPEILALGFAIPRSLKSRRDKGPLKSQLTCASAFRRIGYWELENQVLDIASREVAIG
jgi:hypothetical protein